MTAIAERTLQSELHDLVTPLLERWKVPAVTIATWKDGEVRTAAFGKANLENGQDATPETLFQIGSITKVFTATAAMQLVDNWKIELDEPVKRYLPDFQLADAEATDTLTVHHLLTHHTGFWGDDFTSYGSGDDALGKAITALKGIRQLTRPGETFAYCNAGFQVLGALLEKFHGKPAEQAIQERVIKAIGLERSTFSLEEAVLHPLAVGYNTLTSEEPELAKPYSITRAMAAAGTIMGTVGDLVKFAEFHLGDGKAEDKRVLSSGAIAEMQRIQVKAANLAPNWGLGWWVQDAAGVKLIGHGGSTNGHRANLAVVPDRRFAVASLTNGSSGGAVNRAIERHILREYAGVDRRDPQTGNLPQVTLENYSGRYHSPGGDVTLTPTDRGLALDMFARHPITGGEYQPPTRHALPIGDAEFIVTDTEVEGSTFDFLLQKDGTVRFLRMGGRLYDPVGE